MEIHIERIDAAFKLKATNAAGSEAFIDGSKAIGGGETAFRPMQMLLFSLAGCSAIDVISILKKQRQRIDTFGIKVSAERTEGTPSSFKKIFVQFILTGKIKEHKLAQAIELSRTKYCSVHFSLHPDIDIQYGYLLTNTED